MDYPYPYQPTDEGEDLSLGGPDFNQSCVPQIDEPLSPVLQGEPVTISMVVPREAVAGIRLRCAAPDGTELCLTLPEGVPPGSRMTVSRDPVTGAWKCVAEPADESDAPVEPSRPSEPQAQPGSQHSNRGLPLPRDAPLGVARSISAGHCCGQGPAAFVERRPSWHARPAATASSMPLGAALSQGLQRPSPRMPLPAAAALPFSGDGFVYSGAAPRAPVRPPPPPRQLCPPSLLQQPRLSLPPGLGAPLAVVGPLPLQGSLRGFPSPCLPQQARFGPQPLRAPGPLGQAAFGAATPPAPFLPWQGAWAGEALAPRGLFAQPQPSWVSACG